MNKREELRLKRIEQVFNNVKRLKGNFDKKEMVIEIMSSQEVTERKAKEYLMVAEHRWKNQ